MHFFPHDSSAFEWYKWCPFQREKTIQGHQSSFLCLGRNEYYFYYYFVILLFIQLKLNNWIVVICWFNELCRKMFVVWLDLKVAPDLARGVQKLELVGKRRTQLQAGSEVNLVTAGRHSKRSSFRQSLAFCTERAQVTWPSSIDILLRISWYPFEVWSKEEMPSSKKRKALY